MSPNVVYSAITSLDGYVNDAAGGFQWAAPDEEVHAFVNDLERGVGTYLYGRRMYEVMAAWETMDLEGEPPVMREYAEVWRAADKVVFSRTLSEVWTPRTRLERELDPATLDALDGDVSVGGPTLAAAVIRAGSVDEWHQFVNPVVVGGGTHWLPDDVQVDLDLVDERRFESGVVHLHYRTAA